MRSSPIEVAAITPIPLIRISVLVGTGGSRFLEKDAVRVPLESANAVVESWSGWGTVISPVTFHAEKVQPGAAELVTWKLSPAFSQLAPEGAVLPQSTGLAAIRTEY
jgi:hypothetical protein